MKTKRNALLAVLLVATLVLSACDFSFTTAHIANAFTASDNAGNQPTKVFSQDATFYAIVELANAPDDTVVKAAWVAVDVQDVAPETAIDDASITGGDNVITFNLSNAPNTLWPTGKYRVDLYLNDKVDQSLEFEVQ